MHLICLRVDIGSAKNNSFKYRPHGNGSPGLPDLSCVIFLTSSLQHEDDNFVLFVWMRVRLESRESRQNCRKRKIG